MAAAFGTPWLEIEQRFHFLESLGAQVPLSLVAYIRPYSEGEFGLCSDGIAASLGVSSREILQWYVRAVKDFAQDMEMSNSHARNDMSILFRYADELPDTRGHHGSSSSPK